MTLQELKKSKGYQGKLTKGEMKKNKKLAKETGLDFETSNEIIKMSPEVLSNLKLI